MVFRSFPGYMRSPAGSSPWSWCSPMHHGETWRFLKEGLGFLWDFLLKWFIYIYTYFNFYRVGFLLADVGLMLADLVWDCSYSFWILLAGRLLGDCPMYHNYLAKEHIQHTTNIPILHIYALLLNSWCSSWTDIPSSWFCDFPNYYRTYRLVSSRTSTGVAATARSLSLEQPNVVLKVSLQVPFTDLNGSCGPKQF